MLEIFAGWMCVLNINDEQKDPKENDAVNNMKALRAKLREAHLKGAFNLLNKLYQVSGLRAEM